MNRQLSVKPRTRPLPIGALRRAKDAIMQIGYTTREDTKSAVVEENNQRRV